MSYTNILTRWMNREFINLGFSGNGQLDYEIADVMAKRKDAALFILDFIPNVTEEKIKDRTKNFVNIIRKENPNTPILLVESIIFPHSVFSTETANILSVKNNALRAEYEEMKKNGDKNLYYLNSNNLMNEDGEGTVDGIHLTDLGFQFIAKALQKRLIALFPKSEKCQCVNNRPLFFTTHSKMLKKIVGNQIYCCRLKFHVMKTPSTAGFTTKMR